MKRNWTSQLRPLAAQLFFGAIGLSLLTFICLRLGLGIERTGFVYLIVISLLSMMGSFIGSAVLSVAAVGCLDYFFTEPKFSFLVAYPNDLLAMAAFLTASFVVCGLTAKVRREAEQARISLGDLIETIPGLIWSALPDGSRDFHSRRWLEFTGLSSDEATGDGWIAVFHREDRALVVDSWRRAVATGELFEVEARARNASGEYRSMLVRAAPQRDARGRIVKWYGSSNDIEDRKRATDALRESEEQWREVFEHNPVMYFMIDPTGKILSVNVFGAAQLGYTATELIGQSVLKVFFEEDREFVQKNVAACLETLGPSSNWEVRKVRKDGTVLWVRENAKAVRRANGELIVLVTCEDITKRRQVEDALQLSEAIMAQAQQLASVGSWAYKYNELSRDWDEPEHWSAELWRIIGSDPSEGYPPKQEIFSRIHPEDRQRMVQANNEVFQHGRLMNIQYRFFRRDGKLRVLHSLGTLLGEDRARFVGATQDITEREQRIEKLRSSELYLSEAQRLANMGSWTFDLSGNFDYWSEELFRIYGFDPRQGAPSLERYLDAVHPEDREFMSQLIQNMITKGLGCDVTKRIVRPDGEVRYLRCVGVPNLDNGTLRNIFGTAIDVTEHELLAQELQRRQTYLTEAQTLSQTGSFGWRVSTGEIVWSEQTFRIFEYDQTVKPSLEVVLLRTHPEDRTRVQQFLRQVSDDGKDWDIEHRLLLPGGSLKYVHVVARAVQDASGKLEFVGAVQDITAARRAEEQLNQARAELAHVTRVTTVGELTAAIAHEINQPLTGIVSSGNACLRWLAGETPNLVAAQRAVERIVRDGMRAGDIISRIRALVTKSPPRIAWLDLNDTITEVIALIRAEAQQNRISLRTALAKDLPLVQGDRIQLQQVILNLTINGIEAMSEISGAQRELLVESAKDGLNGVVVSVRDSGKGLDAGTLDSLFEAFYTKKPSGMGMGLAISRTIIEAHDGRLWATPNIPQGAAFHFRLPNEGSKTS